MQKFFHILNQCYKLLQDIEKSTEPHVKSVLNLTEQFVCCMAVHEKNLPNQLDFADIKQRLLVKITTEMNGEIEKLSIEIAKLEKQSDQLSKQYEQCVSQSKKCCKEGHVDIMLEKSPLYPSFAAMLEMAETAERSLREQCSCKKYLVETFNPHETDICEIWEKSWKSGDSQLSEMLQEHLSLTSYFLELTV